MKKRIFDPRLYREAFRQGKMVGLTALVLLTLEAVLLPVGEVINEVKWAAEMAADGMNYVPGVSMMSMMEMHPLLILTFCTATPLLILYLFHFLTKRNACDFYHAIPQTRTCVFLSFFLAALTWIALYTLVPSLVGAGLFAAFPKYFRVNWSNVAHVLFNVTAANVFVASAIAIAVNLTGTVFTNIVVSALIIFVPRIFLTAVSLTVSGQMPMVPADEMMGLLNARYNVVFGCMLNLVGMASGSLTEFSSGLYTLIVGILYGLGALFLFNRRKSEAAGQAAASRKLQLVYRLVVSMLICLIPCVLIFQSIVQKEILSVSEVYLLFVIYVIAAVAYFLYELITTRKWRNLAKAVPGLGILAILNLVLIGGMHLIYTVTLNTTPEADEIRYVNLVNADDPTSYNGKTYEDYFAARTEQVNLESEEVKALVADRLEEEVSLWKEGSWEYNRAYKDYDTVTVGIRTGMRTIYRRIQVNDWDWNTLTNELAQHDAFESAYRDLPAVGENGTVVSVGELNETASQKVYEALREEVSRMSFSNWYVIAESPDLYGDKVLDRLTLLTSVGTGNYASAIPIRMEMPETALAYMEAYNEEYPYGEEVLSLLNQMTEALDGKDDAYAELYVNVSLYGKEAEELRLPYLSYYCYWDGEEGSGSEDERVSLEALLAKASANQGKELNPDGLCGRITVSAYRLDAEGYYEGTDASFFFNLDGLDVLE